MLICQTRTATSTAVKITAVVFNPKPSVVATQSAKLSPTVVPGILISQNQTVTSGTLLSMRRLRTMVATVAQSR